MVHLFLVFIQDLGVDINDTLIHILKFVDGTILIGDTNYEVDVIDVDKSDTPPTTQYEKLGLRTTKRSLEAHRFF